MQHAIRNEHEGEKIIENFETHIDLKDPTNNCLDVAIITAHEKRTKHLPGND